MKETIGVGCADISKLEKKYISQVLKSERLSYGPFIRKFEEEFSKGHETKFGIAVNSGTDALRIAISCLKEKEKWNDGDEIICPAVTFIASSNVILQNNLNPVFVDVERDTYNIDPNQISDKITDKTRAIMPVHLFGQPADMQPIVDISKNRELKIMEDSCETMFAKYHEKSVGSFGEIGCFSTYVAHLIVTGVGGLAITNNLEYAEIMRSLANHGRDGIYISIDDDNQVTQEIVEKRFKFIREGFSSRITELEGALGLAQLERKDEILKKRKRNARELISKLSLYENYIQLPVEKSDRDHVYMMFPIVIKDESKIKKRDLVMFLENNNIETRDMLPLTNQPIYTKRFGEEFEDQFPVAKWINNNGFYIGCHQKISSDELEYIIDKFGEFFKKYG
ncbi:MAG TPA: DegT/DnrJ/EryC1/StrS family aminotransferase [Candidatus Paceibacterota bacterium]|nr:DegT/DnrJ/EryC1/StrS family aminotransferase [Candidatus Paceibacterota bacterium]